jgi:hypothetical protein
MFGGVGVGDEQFRRDATPMRTGAAQRSFFDQRDLQAFGAALYCGGYRVPAAEHNEIVMSGIHCPGRVADPLIYSNARTI